MALSLCLREVPSDPHLGGRPLPRALLAPPALSERRHCGPKEKAPAENRGTTALTDHSLSQKCSCPVCASSKMTSATIATPRSAPNAIISWRALNIRRLPLFVHRRAQL